MVDPSSVGIVKQRFLTMAHGRASSNAKPSEDSTAADRLSEQFEKRLSV